MTHPTTLEDIARRALGGDREALDSLVRALQGDLYGLALRMLWNQEDAEDATQEILVRIVTRLSQFQFQSRSLSRGSPRVLAFRPPPADPRRRPRRRFRVPSAPPAQGDRRHRIRPRG